MTYIRKTVYVVIAVLSAISAACSHDHNHEHDHDHEHEGHDHAAETGEKGHDEDSHKGIVVFTAAQAKAGGVEVKEIQPGSFSGVIRTAGEIMAAQGDERSVPATVAGIVSYAAGTLTPGAPVGAGQALFRVSAKGISTTDNTAALRATLSSAEARLKRAETLLADKLITQTEYDLIFGEVAAARGALSTPATSAVSGATATSPISGYLTECLVRPGDYVAVGTPLALVSTNRKLQLRADVPQRYNGELKQIRGANIVIPSDKDRTLALGKYDAKVVSYGRSGTSTNSLYMPVIIEFNNPGGLTSGTPVQAYLLTEGRSGVISVPRTALTEEEGVYFVYIEVSPEHFRKQRVETGLSDGVSTEIVEGLKGGERIVVKGATLLKLAANSGKAPQGHTHNH